MITERNAQNVRRTGCRNVELNGNGMLQTTLWEYDRNRLKMAGCFRGKEENDRNFCNTVTRQVERYTQNRRKTG